MHIDILNLFEEKFYIIYASHSENMCTKYGRSRMNDAHTISPSDPVSLPAKSVRSTAFFLDSELIFVRPLHRALAGRLRSQHMNSCILNHREFYICGLISTISIQQLLIVLQ